MNLKELRREYHEATRALDDAEVRRAKARTAWIEARIEAGNAEFAARGITPGTTVVGDTYTSARVWGVYVGHVNIGWGVNVEPRVMRVKQDGTAHATWRQVGSNWRLPE